MKKISKIVIASIIVIALFVSIGCQKKDTLLADYSRPSLSSTVLNVRKIDNLDDNFILGMDASSVLSLESSGVKYYDFDGNSKDVFQILADAGINYIRVRVWVDPFDSEGRGYGGGNCDINTAIEMGKRANKYGMRLAVCFHYSDFWADPSKQMIPKAWVGLEYDVEMPNKIYEYTKDSLKKLKDEKIAVGIIQIGNETNQYMCGTTEWSKICSMMNAGSQAVREEYPKALIAVHFTNPEKDNSYLDYASKLNNYNVDYDIFGSSYYPYWHGTLDNLSITLSAVANTYNKKVMVLETSYPYTSDDTDFFGNIISIEDESNCVYPFTIQGQADAVCDVVDELKNKTANGIGVFYWEGTWISVGGNSWYENQLLWEKHGSGWATSFASSYDEKDAGQYYGGCAVDNQAFFDEKGKALESLKVFGLMKNGNNIYAN